MRDGDVQVSLPALTQRHVPKRYEETRPVKIQGFAHHKIIGLGHELHKREVEKAELERLQSIQAAEQAVWEQAEYIKQTALAKAHEEALAEQDKVVKKLKKAHAKALLEEALKVEMAMQKLAIEQVKQERLEGEKRLNEAVAKTEARCEKELIAAVAKARQEEKEIAANEASKVAKANKEKFDSAMKKAENEKVQALKELRDQKDLEKTRAVQEAEGRERRIAKELCDTLTRQFEAVIKDLNQEIEDKKGDIRKLISQIAETEKSKSNIENCLFDTRKDFQDFIDSLPPFDRRQADFLIPLVYLDELERKGYDVQPLRPPKSKKKTKK